MDRRNHPTQLARIAVGTVGAVCLTVAVAFAPLAQASPAATALPVVDGPADSHVPAESSLPTSSVLVFGHRGASGYRPEHTLASYRLAIRQCADYIEPDVVMTKDGVPVVRHENEISGTTDVAEHPEFRSRQTTKIIDGGQRTGWFTEDFTLAELRTLRAVERTPELRPGNTTYDRRYRIPTLAQVLDLARRSRTCSGAAVGVAPETKHPSYFAAIGLPIEKPLLAALSAAGLNHRGAPVIIQSFERSNLQQLHARTHVRLELLVDCTPSSGLITKSGLRRIASYADVVGLCKDTMIPRAVDQRLAAPTSVIRDAHSAGLMVVGWTFRAENAYLPAEFRRGKVAAAHGDLAGEIGVFLDAGMDGFFTDQPDLGVAAVRAR